MNFGMRAPKEAKLPISSNQTTALRRWTCSNHSSDNSIPTQQDSLCQSMTRQSYLHNYLMSHCRLINCSYGSDKRSSKEASSPQSQGNRSTARKFRYKYIRGGYMGGVWGVARRHPDCFSERNLVCGHHCHNPRSKNSSQLLRTGKQRP